MQEPEPESEPEQELEPEPEQELEPEPEQELEPEPEPEPEAGLLSFVNPIGRVVLRQSIPHVSEALC
jgi:hypothetical protein